MMPQTAIAKPTPLRCQPYQAFAQLIVILLAPVPLAAALLLYHRTGPPLRKTVTLHLSRHGFLPLRRPYQFFESKSCNTTLSRLRACPQ